MSLIAKAKAHFNSKAVREKYIEPLEVTVFAHPLNIATKHKWLRLAGGNNSDYLIYAVIYGAVDKDGNRLFSLEDKHALKNQVDSDVVSDIGSFVLGLEVLPEEEREKN